MKRYQYQVVVAESNEIAGEVVTGLAVAFVAKTLADAREWAFEKWGGYPPKGSKIVEARTDVEYAIPRRG